MIVLTVLPVLVLTLIASRNTRDSVEEEIVAANQTRVDWAAQYVEELLQGLDGMFYSLQIDPEFDSLLSEIESSAAPGSARRAVAQLLSAAYFTHSRLVDNLSLYVHSTGEQIVVDNVQSGTVIRPDTNQNPWNGIARQPIALRLFALADGVYALHTINRFTDRELRGALLVRIDRDIAQQLELILSDQSGDRIFLLNDLGEIVLGDGDMPDHVRQRIADIPAVTGEAVVWHGSEILGFASRVDRGRTTVAKTIPVELITRSARDTMTAGLLTGALLAALSVILSIFFSVRISRPISELARSMQEASTPNFRRLAVQSHDEIRMLEDGYHTLLARMKALAQKDYEQEIELKDARLMALQAQINPHFLNNTLNLLGGMALAKGATEVYRLARAVGDMFRYAVGSDGDLVTLEQELAHVRNYLLIQENRFAGRCEIDIQTDPAVLGSPVPRFTLQPIVENAFEHGLQQKTGSWRVRVRCSARRLGTMVAVEDNGSGMDRDSLSALRHNLGRSQTQAGSTSIGLRNVDTRLRLHFGEQTGVRVRSTLGEGTVVLFVLPAPSEPGRMSK
jgi:two-component system sensor histidine kinase YesM